MQKPGTIGPSTSAAPEFVVTDIYQVRIMSTNHEAINTINTEFISENSDYTDEGESSINKQTYFPSTYKSLLG